MKPGISEFSYGYAVTEALVRGSPGLTAAPVFPSLIAEGKPGGGWDVKIPLPGYLLFLQFKLCDVMVTRRAKEVGDGLTLPILRMHIRPGRYSKQHAMLLQLEAQGEAVFYVAPRFAAEEDFNRHYLADAILTNSVFIRPNDVGPLDGEDHHVSFEEAGTDALLYSRQPRRLPQRPRDPLAELEPLRDRAKRITSELVVATAERLETAARAAGVPDSVMESVEHARDLPPMRRLGFVARAVFEVEPVVVQVRG